MQPLPPPPPGWRPDTSEHFTPMLPWPPSLLNATVTSALPQRGHHQGGTPVSIFGSNLLFNTSSQAGIRCCWDHHPGFLGSQTIDGSLVVGGDGVTDEETDATLVSDELVVCPSYSSVPGYTHTDDLLLAFGPSCASSPLLDTGLDFQFYLSTQDMQLVAATPRGGPVAGGTAITINGTDFGILQSQIKVKLVDVGNPDNSPMCEILTYATAESVVCKTPAVTKDVDCWVVVIVGDSSKTSTTNSETMFNYTTPQVNK